MAQLLPPVCPLRVYLVLALCGMGRIVRHKTKAVFKCSHDLNHAQLRAMVDRAAQRDSRVGRALPWLRCGFQIYVVVCTLLTLFCWFAADKCGCLMQLSNAETIACCVQAKTRCSSSRRHCSS